MAKERLWGFVTVADIREVGFRGPEGIINTEIAVFSMACLSTQLSFCTRLISFMFYFLNAYR